MKELVGKKIIWINDDNVECIILQTEDKQYYCLDAGRTKGLLYGPHLHQCSNVEANDLLSDDVY